MIFLYILIMFLFLLLGVVAMHTETLEAVHKEIKRLPPIQKASNILMT